MSDALFDLDPEGNAAQAQRMQLNATDAAPAPAVFQNFGGAVGNHAMRAAANVGRTVAILAAAPAVAIEKLTGTEGQTSDSIFKAVDDYFNPAVDYWTPNAAQTGKAGQIVGGLVEGIAPLALGPAGVPAMLGNAQVGTSTDLMREGVDADTALKVGLAASASNAVGFKIPFLGKTLASRVVSGAAGNLAVNSSAALVQNKTLEGSGYTEAAKQFDPTNTEARALDVLMGAAFGVVTHASSPRPTVSQGDAVLATRNAKNFQQDSAPGVPKDVASSAAHQANMEQAMLQLMRGEKVDLASTIQDADFLKPPEAMRETHVAAAVREAIADVRPAGAPVLPLSGPRGVRNHNPGNIEKSATPWQGKVDGSDPRFETFATPELGIRALAKNLLTSQDRHGNNTITDIINRWAPAKENNTAAYVAAVAKETGLDPTAALNLRDPETLQKLTTAIIHHENGVQPYGADMVRAGVDLAISGRTATTPEQIVKAIPQADNFTPAQRQIETGLRDKIASDYQAAKLEYATAKHTKDSDGGRIINTDIARELSPEYRADRSQSAAVHEPASWFTKELYADKLAELPKGSDVVFTAGGTGAGKSSALQKIPEMMAASEKAGVVFDTNMNGMRSSILKVEQALDAGHNVKVILVDRDPVEALVAGSLPRAMKIGRTVPLDAHLETHRDVHGVMRELQKRYGDNPRFSLDVVDNTRGKGMATLSSLDRLPVRDYNQIERRLYDALQSEHQAGRISDAVYNGSRPSDRRTVQPEGVGVGPVQRSNPTGNRPADGSGNDSGLPPTQHRNGTERPGTQGDRPNPDSTELSDTNRPQSTSAQHLPSGVAGADTSAITERGHKIALKYLVSEANKLITSHDNNLKPNPKFPAELQPRDRERAASEAQIARIENDIHPELLAESPKVADGAPIIGRDGVVESGNARTIALRRAYDNGKAGEYKQWLIDNAGRFGLDPKALVKMKRPVLTRVGLESYDRAEFARQANESSVAHMSSTEIAQSDAARMPDLQELHTNDDGSINVASSMPFVRAFINDAVSPSERGSMMTASGDLSQDGVKRIRNAVFAKAYGDPDIVAMMGESTDANVKNILNGMMRAAPEVARMRDLIEAGARQPLDIGPALVQAVRQFSQLRSEGRTVDQHLAQHSLIDSPVSPEVNNLLIGLQETSRAPKRVAELITSYTDKLNALGDPRQQGMFGDAVPAAHDLMADSVEGLRTEPKSTLPATPEIEAMRKIIQEDPSATVLDGYDADGNPKYTSMSEAAAKIEAEHTEQLKEAQSYDAAVNCLLRRGG